MRRYVGRERRDRSTGRACMRLGRCGDHGTHCTLLARQDLLAPRAEQPPRLPRIEHKRPRAPVGQVIPRRWHAGGGRVPLPNKGPLALKVRLACRPPRIAPPQQRAKGGRREWALHLRDKKRRPSRASAAWILKGNTQQNAVQVQTMWNHAFVAGSYRSTELH